GGNDSQGNYNYGATGSVLFPEDILLRGAGAVQMFLDGKYNKDDGRPWDIGNPNSNYGDQKQDQSDISGGIRFGKWWPWKLPTHVVQRFFSQLYAYRHAKENR